MFDRSPPFDLAAEASVIASLLVSDDVAAKVMPIVSARDFHGEANAWAFEACVALWERGETINQVTVAHELDRKGRLDEAGGHTFLSDLVTNLPTHVGAEHFAAIVKQDAQYRELIGVSVNIAQAAYDRSGDVLSKAEALIFGLRTQDKTSSGFRHLSEFLNPYDSPVPSEERATPKTLFTVHTGLRELDAILGGMKPGQLIVLGARPGQGKSALATCIARNAAVNQNARVAFFSVEMTGEELAMRMLAADARIDSKRVAKNTYTEAEEQRLGHALLMLGTADIYIDSTGGIRPAEIRAKSLKLAKEHGLDVVIVDHLQILRPDKPSGNTVAELTEITRDLKAMAMQFDVAVILCSQLNRDNFGQVPILSDLRGSGSIEQDADVVIFIHRQEMHVLPGAKDAAKRAHWEKEHDPYDPYPAGHAFLVVAKQRSGATGLAEARYRASYTKFEDFDPPAAEAVQGVIPEFMLNGTRA